MPIRIRTKTILLNLRARAFPSIRITDANCCSVKVTIKTRVVTVEGPKGKLVKDLVWQNERNV